MKNKYTVHWNEGDGCHGAADCETLEAAREAERECLAEGWEVIVTNNETKQNEVPIQRCMVCDLLVGMRTKTTLEEMEKIIIASLAKAGIDATISTVEIVEGTIKK